MYSEKTRQRSMSHLQNQSDNTPATTQTAGYGDSTEPITTDEYGNPLHVQTGGPEDYRAHDQHHTLGGLHPSGSPSSSSSSEDDGQGGRRRKKKGIKEKIKEKLPGSQKDDHQHQSSTTATSNPAGHYATADHEKKGIIDKIKEKLPGHHPPHN